MAQSKEYPDLKFVEPRAWGTGRDGRGVRFVVIHYTAGAERATSAEDGAAYDQRRTDGTSTHYFVDSNSVVQCVYTWNRANAARHHGNRLGIQYELCGTAQTRAQWMDAASMATLRNAARQVARDCRRYGIPVRRLTTAQTRSAWTDYPNGPKGIVGHVDCTNAYPEDGGDHTDPGKDFPWDVFLEMVRAEMAPEPEKENDMAEAEIIAAVNKALASEDGQKAIRAAIHGTVLGRGTTTIGQVLQPLPSQIGALLAYASAEAAEVPPTAVEIADETVARLEPLPPVEPAEPPTGA